MDNKRIARELMKVAKELTADVSKTITKIEKLTDINNHSEAVVVLADMFGDNKEKKAAEAIVNLQDYLKNIPKGLSDIRYTLLKRLLKKAEMKLSPEEYQKLYMAF